MRDLLKDRANVEALATLGLVDMSNGQGGTRMLGSFSQLTDALVRRNHRDDGLDENTLLILVADVMRDTNRFRDEVYKLLNRLQMLELEIKSNTLGL